MRHFCETNTSAKIRVAVNTEDVKGTKIGSSGQYMIMYTCGVCDHRQSRTFTKDAYHKGIVIVRCEGCEKQHLIADNLGWFHDGGKNIEQIMQEKGEGVTCLNGEQAIEFFRENDE